MFGSVVRRLWKERAAPAAAPTQAVAAHLDAALDALERHDIAAARTHAQALLDQARTPRALALRAHVQLLDGAPDAARGLLLEAQALAPQDPDMLRTWASLHSHVGDAAAEAQVRLRLATSSDGTAQDAVDAVRAMAAAQRSPRAMETGGLRELLARVDAMAPGPSADQSLALAEALFGLAGWEADATRLFARHHVAAPGRHVQRLAQASPNALPPDRARLHQVGPGAGVLTLEGGDVLPGLQGTPALVERGLLVRGFFTALPRTARLAPGSDLLAYRQDAVIADLPQAPDLHVDGPALLLGLPTAPNYYHALHDHLSRLAVLDQAGIGSDGLPVLVAGELAPFERECHALLGIGPERLIDVRGRSRVRVQRLVAPLPLAVGGKRSSPLIAAWARERFVAAVSPLPANAHRRVYVTRRATARRRVANEEEVCAVLAARGFEIVQPEHLSVREQVALFAQVRVLLGSGGAAFTNMLFMPPGGTVVMLNNRYIPPHAKTLFFGPLSQACGHAFHIVSGEPVAFPTPRAIDADVRIDCGELARLLDAQLDS